MATRAKRTTSKLRRLEVCLTEVAWSFQIFSLFSIHCSPVTRQKTFLELFCMYLECFKYFFLRFKTAICRAWFPMFACVRKGVYHVQKYIFLEDCCSFTSISSSICYTVKQCLSLIECYLIYYRSFEAAKT